MHSLLHGLPRALGKAERSSPSSGRGRQAWTEQCCCPSLLLPGDLSWPLWPPGQSHSCTPSPKSHSPIGKGDAEPWEILSPEVLKMYSSQPGKGGNRLATGKCFIGIICLWFDFQITLEIYHSTTNPPEINPHINSINTKNRDVPHPLLHMVCWAH